MLILLAVILLEVMEDINTYVLIVFFCNQYCQSLVLELNKKIIIKKDHNKCSKLMMPSILSLIIK